MYSVSRVSWLAAIAAVWAIAGQSQACTVSSAVTSTLGTYSPAAVKAAAVPALQSRAGLACGSGVLVLLGGNVVQAKFHSDNGFKLKQASGSEMIGYVASADPAGAAPFAEGATLDYMQNNLLNLLGLLGGSSADLPVYVKPASTTQPAPGVYSDRITIDWSWNLCPGIGLLGLCIGVPDTGTGASVITVTLIVSPQNAVMTISTTTTWDPLNGVTAPKAIPGSRRRVSVTLANPDIVPIDAGTIALVLPTPPHAILALDGDGTGGVAARFADGSPASQTTLRYGGPGDASDDVDFSADGGVNWTYAPVAGDAASQGAVTHMRFRPQGAMAKQSSLTVSAPFLVR
ncbi:spore coat protein U domain-containing protein [Caulobacter sp. RHG1]|uniref:spore coat protein U domain-containing protein n=1 Tax=Caulobacter sp. (strain RHG1) TaxID=2545762 RepID=UPI0015536936|nr:spore coat protein U domain-containing protein [Caulobacter sp. RHG1]NQE61971.1 hypothetical protein [Caulobacter sp. RHG1]